MTSEDFFEQLNKLSGTNLLTKAFFRNGKFIFFLFFCAMLYMTNRYWGEKELIRIEKLKMELKDMEFEVRSLNSKLMKSSRQSQIYTRLKEMGSPLEPAKTPPFELKK